MISRKCIEPVVGRLLGSRVLFTSVIVLFLGSLLLLVWRFSGDLLILDQAGYGDIYVYHTVDQFQRTGAIYRDVPGELPAAYGPLLYTALAAPARFFHPANWFLAPRLIEFATFLLCAFLASLIGRALIPGRCAFLWCFLLACSYVCMNDWVLQLRGDFMAIAFDLLSIRLLMARSSRTVLLAGLCAGVATQFKFTYVAALGAGILWLLIRREWKNLAAFVVAGLLGSVGVAAAFWVAEPKMIAQIFAVTNPLRDVPGLLRIILTVLEEPIFLIALATLPSLILCLHWRGRWALLVAFVCFSLFTALATGIQAGANVNYFFEALFGLAPCATLGLLKLSRERSTVGVFLASMILLVAAVPRIRIASTTRQAALAMNAYNKRALALRATMQGRRVLALAPEVAILAPEIILSDPFTAAHMERVGRFDLRPLAQQIRTGLFDVVVTYKSRRVYRGIDLLSPTLRSAILGNYRPYCALDDSLFFMHANGADSSLERQLATIGCDVQACSVAKSCEGW